MSIKKLIQTEAGNSKFVIEDKINELISFLNDRFPDEPKLDVGSEKRSSCHDICTNGKDSYHNWNLEHTGKCTTCGAVAPLAKSSPLLSSPLDRAINEVEKEVEKQMQATDRIDRFGQGYWLALYWCINNLTRIASEESAKSERLKNCQERY
jgi:hypothetical protein